MSHSFWRPLISLQDRWRWIRGHCPLCNRNLYSAFPYYMADYPNCPVCKGETHTNSNMWNKHRTLGVAKGHYEVGEKA
jgi:hypothetical protein